jgi:hypothetical protein
VAVWGGRRIRQRMRCALPAAPDAISRAADFGSSGSVEAGWTALVDAVPRNGKWEKTDSEVDTKHWLAPWRRRRICWFLPRNSVTTKIQAVCQTDRLLCFGLISSGQYFEPCVGGA